VGGGGPVKTTRLLALTQGLDFERDGRPILPSIKKGKKKVSAQGGPGKNWVPLVLLRKVVIKRADVPSAKRWRESTQRSKRKISIPGKRERR